MSALLTVDKISSGYGDIPVLRDVSLQVGANEIVSVVGANGAGKTTLLRSIAGLLPCTHGTIQFYGQRIDGLPAHQVVVRGLVMVPEGGRLFPFMSIQENLELGAFNNSARPQLNATLEEVFTLVSDSCQPAPSIGRQLVGRRTADVRHCPRSYEPTEAADAGRAVARPVSAHGRARIRDHRVPGA